jgi:hypothetical protein
MSNKIVQLKDKLGNLLYPKTVSQEVLLADNLDLSTAGASITLTNNINNYKYLIFVFGYAGDGSICLGHVRKYGTSDFIAFKVQNTNGWQKFTVTDNGTKLQMATVTSPILGLRKIYGIKDI